MAEEIDPNLLQKGMVFYHTYVESTQRAVPTSFLQLMMDGRPDWVAGTKYPDRSGREGVALTPGLPVSGLTARECVFCIEEIARTHLEDALGAASSTMFCGKVIERFGTDDQKKKWCSSDPAEQRLGAYAISEPDAGSDAAMIASRVRLQGNDLVLTGKKSFVVNGDVAHYLLVFATGAGNTDEERSRLSSFIVAANKKGVVKNSRNVSGINVTDIEFQDVKISRDDILGGAGQGYQIAQSGFDHLRLTTAAACAAAARTVFDRALEDAKSRKQFGRAHVEFDMIGEKLLAMTEALYAMDALIAFVASMADEGRDFSTEAAVARVFCAKTASFVADESLQIAGARGLAEDSDFMKTHRQLRAFRFVGGADEVLKLFIMLHGARPAAEFITAAKKGRSGAGAFDAAIKLWWKGFRLSLRRPNRKTSHAKLKEAGATCGEAAGVLAERIHLVFKYYGAEVAEHEFELRRMADMAIEITTLSAVIARSEAILSGTIEGDKELAAVAPGWRARRAWRRMAVWSSEIFLPEDLEMDKLAERFLPNQLSKVRAVVPDS